MKFLVAALLLCSSMAFAGGEVFFQTHYLDDINQTLAPSLGIDATQNYLGLEWQGTAEVGYIQQLPQSTASNNWARLAGDVFYHDCLTKGLKVGVGGGLESSAQTLKYYDDYVHVTVAYPLW